MWKVTCVLADSASQKTIEYGTAGRPLLWYDETECEANTQPNKQVSS